MIACSSGVLTEITSFGVYSSGSQAYDSGLCNHNNFDQFDPGN